MKPLKPHQVMSKEGKPGPGRSYTGSYGLWALTTPTGRSFYFISAYRRTILSEELEVSPVIASNQAHALDIFERLAVAGQVAPVHLPDVVHDLRLSDDGLPRGDAAAQALP